LADVFQLLGVGFESERAMRLNVQIFETIYHSALSASCGLAKLLGEYDSYRGSPVSAGVLQFDMWGVTPTKLWDWEKLRAEISEHGLRNSLLVAPMPTASTAQIMGNNECFEPYTSNLYSRRVLAGEFTVTNPHLVRALEKEGLWSSSMREKLLKNDGSVQDIPEISVEMKEIFKTAWEISSKVIIDMAAARAPFVDQSQSMNIHMKAPTSEKLSSMHFYGWSKGLKTGSYYIRARPASSAIKFTLTSGGCTAESCTSCSA
jgi:ribonucleoside-diphosphate reductase subunit M1